MTHSWARSISKGFLLTMIQNNMMSFSCEHCGISIEANQNWARNIDGQFTSLCKACSIKHRQAVTPFPWNFDPDKASFVDTIEVTSPLYRITHQAFIPGLHDPIWGEQLERRLLLSTHMESILVCLHQWEPYPDFILNSCTHIVFWIDPDTHKLRHQCRWFEQGCTC